MTKAVTPESRDFRGIKKKKKKKIPSEFIVLSDSLTEQKNEVN